MIYELCVVAKTELQDESVEKLNELVRNVVSDFQGEVLIQDDWGPLTFAQMTAEGIERGRFLYFIVKHESSDANKELTRRFHINEGILRHMIVQLGENKRQEELVKNYKTPYSKKYRGSVVDDVEESEGDVKKERRRFARRKNCWFTAKKLQADWKDPNTFGWLVNEFGKISPARVTGISRKHQRFATSAIKRARNIGLASYISNAVAE